jgi:hypothetical protein
VSERYPMSERYPRLAACLQWAGIASQGEVERFLQDAKEGRVQCYLECWSWHPEHSIQFWLRHALACRHTVRKLR